VLNSTVLLIDKPCVWCPRVWGRRQTGQAELWYTASPGSGTEWRDMEPGWWTADTSMNHSPTASTHNPRLPASTHTSTPCTVFINITQSSFVWAASFCWTMENGFQLRQNTFCCL